MGRADPRSEVSRDPGCGAGILAHPPFRQLCVWGRPAPGIPERTQEEAGSQAGALLPGLSTCHHSRPICGVLQCGCGLCTPSWGVCGSWQVWRTGAGGKPGQVAGDPQEVAVVIQADWGWASNPGGCSGGGFFQLGSGQGLSGLFCGAD